MTMDDSSDRDISPELLRQVSESICDGIIVIDCDFTIQYVNSHFADNQRRRRDRWSG